MTCRRCARWKRREYHAGVCWHPTQPDALVTEDDTCAHFDRKVVLVSRSRERSDPLPTSNPQTD
jgi:hypothetical protein